MDEDKKAEQLAHLSKEIERLIERVAEDVRDQRDDLENPPHSGFVLYLLQEADRSPVETEALKELGIESADIAGTDGFTALSDFCESLQLQARVENAVRSTQSRSAPCVGIVVDGWP